MSRLSTTPRFPNIRSLSAALALAAGTACALTGCGTMPTAPVAAMARIAPTSATNAATPMLVPADPADGGSMNGTSDPGTGDAVASDTAAGILSSFALHPSTRGVTRAGADISSAGGTVRVGRWRVDVPANAFGAPVHVTLAVAGRGAACQVQFDPAAATPLLPLSVTVDCRGQAANRISGWVILAFDATSAQWLPVNGSSADKRQHTVSASVPGAGVYGVGTPSGTPAW